QQNIQLPAPGAPEWVREVVGVDVQKSAGAGLVQTAAVEVGVGEEMLDPGEALERLDERRRAEIGDDGAARRSHPCEIGEAALLLVYVVVERPAFLRDVELASERRRDVRVQET